MSPAVLQTPGWGPQGGGNDRPRIVPAAAQGGAVIEPPKPGELGMIVVFSEIPGLTKAGVLSRPFFFQVPPLDAFSPKYAWNFNDYATIGFGMHSNPQYAQLATISFSSMFVDTMQGPRNPFYVVWPFTGSAGPLSGIKALRALGDSMTPFVMQAGQPELWNEWEPLGHRGRHALAVTLRDFSPEERAGEPDTRYFTITVSEFADAPAQSDLSVTRPSMAT
jgi:hypothetical protein